MPYPNSPFGDEFNTEILIKTVDDFHDEQSPNSNINKILKWLCSSPKISSFRVNTLMCDVEDVMKIIKKEVIMVSKILNLSPPNIYIHPSIPYLIILENYDQNELKLEKKKQEVIVDEHCAAAILRGAHIFAPGVLGMTSGVKINDEVSVYTDLIKGCKKGLQKIYDLDKKLFIGNGVAKLTRNELFSNNIQTSGVAVQLTNTISGCPPLGDSFLPLGSSLLQNIPSVICIEVLNPLPGETILDMCASPGNKTTHIAAKMKNEGLLIALDKTPTKIKQLKNTCEKFKATALIYQADSTKIVDDAAQNLEGGPPFSTESFDRILLDAPCSALGKRPQILNKDTEKVIKSFVSLQKNLIKNAVPLLKTNGILVYSTCTITTGENEDVVAWCLKTFPCMELEKAKPYLGSNGLPSGCLTKEQLHLVQRFGPDDNVDSVGFFIAKFKKINYVQN